MVRFGTLIVCRANIIANGTEHQTTELMSVARWWQRLELYK